MPGVPGHVYDFSIARRPFVFVKAICSPGRPSKRTSGLAVLERGRFIRLDGPRGEHVI